MSIQSMTGFGKGSAENDEYSLSVEIKSVNNRFKDIRFKMGSVFNSIEISLKKKIEKTFQRGSFDVFINYKKNAQKKSQINLDFDKIRQFVSEFESRNIPMSINPTEFIRSDFFIEDETKEEVLLELLAPAFDEAIQGILESRSEEGAKLVSKLREHQEVFEQSYLKVIDLKGGYQEKVKEKLLKRIDSDGSDITVDEPRFLQEVIYYLEKLDIDEEINRIKIHLDKLTKTLSSPSEVGRQIDFLIQELNRETNTIGSKSGSQDISEHVVEMKVQLEKIREQALNLQ